MYSKKTKSLIERSVKHAMNASRQTEQFYQCQECGHLHKVEVKNTEPDSETNDKLYKSLWCVHCKVVTQQLDCGTQADDVYIYYNVNVDPNYYN